MSATRSLAMKALLALCSLRLLLQWPSTAISTAASTPIAPNMKTDQRNDLNMAHTSNHSRSSTRLCTAGDPCAHCKAATSVMSPLYRPSGAPG